MQVLMLPFCYNKGKNIVPIKVPVRPMPALPKNIFSFGRHINNNIKTVYNGQSLDQLIGDGGIGVSCY